MLLDEAEEGAVLFDSGRSSAYTDVISLLDKEIAKAKDCGDFQTAEVFELIRAKVKAHAERK